MIVGCKGLILIEDYVFIEKLVYFDREWVLEWVVYVCGVGVYGKFVIKKSMKKYIMVKFL